MKAGKLRTRITIQYPKEEKVNGAMRLTYLDENAIRTHCEWAPEQGSEEPTTNVMTAVERATVTLRYRKDITGACRILLEHDREQIYHIITPPVDVDMKHRMMRFTVERRDDSR